MYRVLSLMCVVVVCVHSAPALDRLARDKQRLSVLIQELSDVVNDLNTDVQGIEKKEAEPVVDAEISEVDTEARLEEKRRRGKGNEDSDESVNDLESKDNKDLRDEIKLLLALARQRTTKDNHDWPMPFNKKSNTDEDDN